MNATAVIQQVPQQPIETNLPISIAASSTITLAVTSFAAKWMFSQIVVYWHQQIQDLKSNLQKLDADIGLLASKDEDLRNELANFKCAIAQEYVSREDWIRASVGMENKIDRLGLRIDDKFERLFDRMGGLK